MVSLFCHFVTMMLWSYMVMIVCAAHRKGTWRCLRSWGAGTVGVSGGGANTARCHRELHEYLSHLCYKFELKWIYATEVNACGMWEGVWEQMLNRLLVRRAKFVMCFHQNSSSWAPYWILSFAWAKFMVGRSLLFFVWWMMEGWQVIVRAFHSIRKALSGKHTDVRKPERGNRKHVLCFLMLTFMCIGRKQKIAKHLFS